MLQSYILSTTTETRGYRDFAACCIASIVHPFNNNWNYRFLISKPSVLELQSYILSTTTETEEFPRHFLGGVSFNRTSFQQQLKPNPNALRRSLFIASIVHPFNNNWNRTHLVCRCCKKASIVHPFNNNWNKALQSFLTWPDWLQSYILSTTTETSRPRRSVIM